MLSIRFLDFPVVRKLRIVFGAILALVLLSSFIGGYQLKALSFAKDKTIEVSVPALLESQRLAALLSNFSEVAARLRIEESSEVSGHLSDDLNQISTNIASAIEGLDGLFTDFDVLNVELKSLNRIKRNLINYKLVQLKRSDATDTVFIQLTQLREQFKALMEPYLLEATLEYKSSLRGLEQSSSENEKIEMQWQEFMLHGEAQAQLTEISFRLSNLIDKVESIPSFHENDLERLDRLKREFEFETLGITQLLVAINDLEVRTNLALLVTEFRAISLSENGVFLNESGRIENSAKFRESILSKAVVMAKVVTIINANTAMMERNTLDSAIAFDETLRKTVITLISVVVIIFGLVMLVVHFVVELQLNQRMLSLTSAVKSISDGDVNHQVNIKGHDEIGQMALALEVFKANAKDLKRSNMELEQFAYAASHDLKSPLSSIKMLAEWIKEDSIDLPADSKANLDLLLSRVNRLSSLQGDLLEYAKAGQSENVYELLDLPTMVNSLFDLLDPEKKFAVNVSQPTDLSVQTVIAPLRQVLLNLINNAIKHSDKANGSICIGVTFEQSRLQFSVSDDGPGIEERYHEEIFGMFKTLQSKDVVEGSGLGLSLVRKVIDRTGGSIKVVSESGKGATFDFDWPAQWVVGNVRRAA